MKHGYKLVELLTSVGGVAPIATLSSQHGQEVKAALAALDRLELLVRRRGGSVMLEELWRQLQGAAGASPGVDGAAAAAVVGGGGRSSRQEELGSAFPDLVAAIPESRREESQGELTISERVERLGLASRLSLSPPYS